MKNNIYIITGAPGVGKNAVADQLREFFPKSFFLDIDLFRAQIGKADMNAHDQDYLNSLEIAASTVNFLLQSKLYTPIFIVDCMSPKRIESFIPLLQEHNSVKKIILWLDDKILKKRIHSREGHFFYDYECAKKMNNWFLELKDFKGNDVLFLDRSSQEPRQTAMIIKKAVC